MFANLPDRNNTSFAKELSEALKTIKLSKDDFLRYHQKIVVEYLAKYNGVRGILAYHKMGSGKTILAAAICEILLKIYPDRQIIFIANKSLHGNFIKKGLTRYLVSDGMAADAIEAYIKKNYSFVTMNASNMLAQVHAASRGDYFDAADIIEPDSPDPKEKPNIDGLLNLTKKIIVFDEWHNLLNSIANGSKNAVGLYDAGMRAVDCNIIGLTGTPIVNDPYEMAIGFNLLAGPIPSGTTNKAGIPKTTTLFGEDYPDFIKNFVEYADNMNVDTLDKHRPRIKNRDKFCDRIMGLVSYYGADTDEVNQFPLEFDTVVKRVAMSNKQYASYITARDKELEENKRGIFKTVQARLKKSSSVSTSSYRVRSRQISNFLYPSNASKTWRDESGYIRWEQYLDKVNINDFQLPNLNTNSPKIVSMLENISMHLPKGTLDDFKPSPAQQKKINTKRTELNKKKFTKTIKSWAPGIGPGLVYSQFLDSGVKLLGNILKSNGMTEILIGTPLEKAAGGTFAIISGEVPPEDRDQLVEMFNNPNNRDGSRLSLLLITQTGAEGLDLQGGRHVHVMEPYWHWSRIRQIITRIVRLMSHDDLPPGERSVQPYIYLSDYPNLAEKDTGAKIVDDVEIRMKLEPTTDVTLYYKAIQNQMLIEDFLSAMQDSSIDCLIHYSATGKCRICSPTGQVLWHSDMHKDMDVPSPCQPYKTSTVKTKKLIIHTDEGDLEYRYTKEGATLRFFEYNPAIQAYAEIFTDSPNYELLVSSISN